MLKQVLTYFFLCVAATCLSQPSFPSIWPLDPPLTITGNYGELRPNHFHGGLDFSTNGKLNLQVYAVEEGYVSRIKVSASGYGKSVYITHPNGKVTVYAHLNAYSLKIAQLVLKEQHSKKSFEVELFPKPGSLMVRKNEIIGLSGNTGGSTGPHLHFEIRDEKSETPLNPLTFLKIKDGLPPVIQKIGFYDLADTTSPQFIRSFKLRELNSRLLAETDTLRLPVSIVGFAFSGFDKYLVNGNPNNVFAAKLYLDGQLIYSHTLDKIDFSDNRYVNEFSEVIGLSKFQKCFLPTLYPPNLYGACVNKGRIVLTDTKPHSLLLVVTDESGNERKMQTCIKAVKLTGYNSLPVSGETYVNCSKDTDLKKNGIVLRVPAKTFFYSASLSFANTLETNNRIEIQPSTLRFHNAAILGFKVSEKLKRDKHRLILKSGSAVYSPQVRNDSVFYNVKSLGVFLLCKDSLGPVIRTQLAAKQLKKVTSPSSFSFIVDDKESGLSKYNLYVNGNWVVGEYDAKSDLVTYFFDEGSPRGNLEFRLEAEDNVGNKSVFTYVLRRL